MLPLCYHEVWFSHRSFDSELLQDFSIASQTFWLCQGLKMLLKNLLQTINFLHHCMQVGRIFIYYHDQDKLIQPLWIIDDFLNSLKWSYNRKFCKIWWWHPTARKFPLEFNCAILPKFVKFEFNFLLDFSKPSNDTGSLHDWNSKNNTLLTFNTMNLTVLSQVSKLNSVYIFIEWKTIYATREELTRAC